MDNDWFLCNSSFHTKLINKQVGRDEERLKKLAFKYTPIVQRYVVSAERQAALALHEGDARMDGIISFLNRAERSEQQKQFHHSFLSASLRVIYGDTYKKERHRICKKYGFTTTKQQVLVCAPRRIGKTFAVAFYCIAMAIIIPEVEISIFSPGKRQSQALMGHIQKYLEKVNESARIIRSNEEKLILRSMNGKMSKINAYPSNPRTLKGVSGHILVLEEMAQIDEQVMYEVVAPLLQIDITCMLAISTITDEENFMTKFLSIKNKHGEPVFTIERIYLACEQCRKNNVAAACSHNNHLLPDWSSARKRKIVNAIMQGQEELLEQEIGGIATVLNKKAFNKDILNRCQNLPRFVFTGEDYPFFFVSIDPNALGKMSEFAIVSILRVNGQFIIIGIDSFKPISITDMHDSVVEHVNNIRRFSCLSRAKAVMIVESNLGNESAHLEKTLCDKLVNFLFMTDGKSRGFRTTQTTKELGVERIKELLSDDAVRIVDDKYFVSARSSALKMINA